MTITEKKDWAKLLYTRENLSQKEISLRTGVSAVTISKWVNADGNAWDKMRKSLLVTREEQLRRLYNQLDELNTAIMNREEGQRYANSKDADIISKLTVAIRTLETEASIAEVVEVCKRVLNYIRPIDPAMAQKISIVFDDFIKNTMSK